MKFFYVKTKKKNNLIVINSKNISKKNESLEIKKLITLLYEKNIQSLIVEGGQKTLSYFIKNGLWDKARVFKTERILNDGLVSPILNKNEHNITTFGSDKLYTYNND